MDLNNRKPRTIERRLHELRDSIIEMGRLTYKSSGVCVYLPKSVVNALHLDPELDRKLVIFGLEGHLFGFMKDIELVAMFKPTILDFRKKALEVINKLTKKE